MGSEVYLILLIFFAQSTALDLTINSNGKSIVHESAGNNYAIRMWEELELPIKLGSFIYTGIRCESPITSDKALYSTKLGSNVGLEFRLPSTNANNNLGLTLTKTESDVWEIDITLRQDYETLPSISYYFIISAGTDTVSVGLNIININDNSPIISAASASCQVEEHNILLTDCRYTVYDADGYIQSLSTSLSGDYNDMFEFVYETDVTSDTTKDAVLLLKPKVELDYEAVTLYVMDLTVTDTPIVDDDNALEGTGRVVVEVTDIADTPPIWTSIFASKQFEEMEEQVFEVIARDGDLGVNDDIEYSKDDSWDQYITIGQTTGVITVRPIDRDAEGEQIFSFEISACEVNEPKYCINQTIAFLVDDINNKIPVITVSPTAISIPENYYDDLGFSISVEDLDLGANAMYTVILNSTGDQHTAFTVAPLTGYQQTDIFIYVTNYRLLDYENEPWQNFVLTLSTEDSTDPFHTDSVELTITLENLNDEIPIFDIPDGSNGYTAEIRETAPVGSEVLKVTADDLDIGDTVRYSLLGTYINSILTIDADGYITTLVDGAFDYETQEEVILQVQAIDSLFEPYNTAIAQVTITVIDENDETPRITVGSERAEIEENLENDTEIIEESSDFLTAIDDDQNADLEFDIVWENSYATKTGRRLTDEQFEPYLNCIRIVTVETTSSGNTKGRSARAQLYINEVQLNDTPDYELFDILYLNVRVTDTDQSIGTNTDSVTIPIYIIDIDDEPPVFQQSTIDSAKNVVEESLPGTIIAVIIATDVDSDEIFYSVEAQEDLYDGLVGISENGELYVLDTIDADIPIYDMSFTVTASDGERDVSETITISVTDINDIAPEFVSPESGKYFYVKEYSPSGTIAIEDLVAEDGDRDAPNNEVSYRLSDTQNNQLIASYFTVVDNRLEVSSDTLDRDNERPGIVNAISIEVYDRSNTNQLSSTRTFYVTLTDINNNPPDITTESLEEDENLNADGRIGQINADDFDEEGTENTRVNFEILNIVTQDGEVPAEVLFDLNNADPNTRTVDLIAKVDMRGYHGTYIVTVKAQDQGTEPGPQESTSEITVIINKYNFMEPLIIYPESGKLKPLRLIQTEFATLILYNGEQLQNFEATDQQNNKYQLEFSILDSEVFAMRTISDTTARLELISPADTSETYTLTLRVRAVDANPDIPTDMSITVQFFDSDTEPIFNTNTDTIQLRENTTGLSAVFVEGYFENIPDELIDEFTVYYMIMSDENEAGFVIEENTVNRIAITNVLDREEVDTHIVRIQTSGTEGGVAVPLAPSVLTLTIQVLDINDNPPNFDRPIFFGSITSSVAIASTILQPTATDLDIDDTLTYTIKDFQNIPDDVNNNEPFIMNPGTGDIVSTMQVLDNAEGYFLFNIQVSDGEHVDIAIVNIYIMSEVHRVEFLFHNELNVVNASRTQIALILETQFEYTCIIDQILQNTDDDGNPIESETIVRVHFVNAELNEPVIRSTIESTANDIQVYQSLVTQFERFELLLVRFLQNTSTTENMEEVLRAWLIGITVVLGTLCVLLLVAFILKTRSLSKRLNKLSVIRYGSQESVNNRRAAPFTNKHATEGSNPAYSEDKIRAPGNEDANSVGSGDSDLVGVENNPEFDYKYEKQNGNA